MKTIEKKTSKQVSDLIIINNDRYEGYKTAAEETKDADLKAIFAKYSKQSKKFSEELQALIPDTKYSPEPGETKNSGKLYRVFMNVKSAIQGKDRKGVLSSCEFGEDTANQTYDEALENQEEFEKNIIEVIRRQKGELQQAHDKIKAMRDTAQLDGK